MTAKRIYFILCLFCWIYLWLRAGLTSMSHDEIATFFYYVHTGDFLPFSAHWDANNHFLNSGLTTLFYNLFGSSPLVLRLANVLFAPLYFFYLYRISGEISNRNLRWSFLVSLVFTHNFIAFFALSRGYGMSMAFLAGALWHLVSFMKTTRVKDGMFSMIFIFLALTANLNLLVTFMIVFLFLPVVFFIKRPKERKRRDTFFFGLNLFGIIPFILSFIILVIMKDKGNLYGGTSRGFWEGTVDSLTWLLSGSTHPVFTNMAFFFLIVSVIIYLALFVRHPSINFLIDPKNLFFLLFTGNIAGIFLLSGILKIHYPEDRMVLQLYPLFTGSLVFALDKVNERIKMRFAWLLLLPFVFFPLNFIYSLNISYPFVYKVDHIPRRFYDRVLSAAAPGRFPPTLGAGRLRHFCWSYLDFQNGGKLSQLWWQTYPGNETDFVIADTTDIPKLNRDYVTINHDDISGRSLLKRKLPVPKVLVQKVKGIYSKGFTEKEYISLFTMESGNLKGKTIYAGYDLTIHAKAKPFVAWITLAAFDKNGRQINYSFIALDWLRTSWNGEPDNFISGTFLDHIPENAYRIESYLWNMEKTEFRLSNGRVFIYSLLP